GLLHDGEPEPQSAPIFPSLHVRFEQVLGRPFRQSIAPILELYERLIVVASASDDHAATGNRELDCVADQVRGHGMQQPPISFHTQLLVYVEREPDSLVLCLWFDLLDGLGEHVADREPLDAKLNLWKSRRRQDLIYEVSHAGDAPVEHLDQLTIG